MPNYQFGSSGIVFTDENFAEEKKEIADKRARGDVREHPDFRISAPRGREFYKAQFKFYMLREDVRALALDQLKWWAMVYFEVSIKTKLSWLWGGDNKSVVRLIDEAAKNDVDLVGEAIKKGIAVVDVKDDDGKTLLHYAAECGLLSVAQTLKRHGADIDARDKNQQTPLHIAVESGALAIVLDLIKPETRADINIEDNFGRTPFDIAEELFDKDAPDGEEKKRREKIKVNIKKAIVKRQEEEANKKP